MSSICGGLGVRIWPITTTTVPTSDWRRRRPRGGRSTPDRHGRNSSLASGRRSAPSVHVVSSGLIIVATTSGAMPWPINRGADCTMSRWEAAQEPIANSPAVGIRPRKCRTGMHAGCDRTSRTRISVFDDPQRDGFPYRYSFTLKSTVTSLRVAVHDPGSGAVGSLTVPVAGCGT